MQPNARVFATTALISAAGLLLELSLARILSVILLQSYVFLILSLAVLGLGLGAALVALFPSLRRESHLPLWLALAALCTVAIVAIVVSLMGRFVWLLFAVAVLPYLFVGLVLTALFARFAAQSSALYAVDLAGAGLAVLLSIPLLNYLGGVNAALLVAALLAIASLLLKPPQRLTGVISLSILLLFAGQLATSVIRLDLQQLKVAKPILEPLQAGAELRQTRWDAFARTDLLYRADQAAYYLYMDGGAGSVVPDAARPERWQRDIGSFPFLADAPTTAFLLGAGGGLDVALAKQAGTPELTVVEVNRASIAMVKTLETYAGTLYTPPVRVIADEGRSALLRTGEHYDLIFLSQVVTGAAEARGLVLAENKLYTTEAFHDYLNHLTPDGQIALKLYDELTLTRAFLTAVKALTQTGRSEAEASQHLFAILDTRANPPIPLLIVKKEALSREEAIRLARVAEGAGYGFLFIPHLLANPPLDGLATGTLTLADIIQNASATDLRPVTDNRPFFYQFAKGLPSFLRLLVWGCVMLAVLGLVLWGLILKQLEPAVRAFPPIFALLGFGFMALELSLLQRSQLLLGHPTLALGLTLGVLLLGAGLGSFVAGRVVKDRRVAMLKAVLAIVLGWLLWLAVWPLLETALMLQPLALRLGMAGLAILPLAFVLGMPFPLALTFVSSLGSRQLAAAWAVNGVTSVMGSIIATALALLAGFQLVALMVAGCYLLVGLLLLGQPRK